MTLTPEDIGRMVKLEGAQNFRDFGGYPTADGRHVRRGSLFRSNRLSQLTQADIAMLDEAGIATIFDLRAPREREADPTAWTAPHLDIHSWPPGHKRRLVDMAMDYPQTAAGAESLMLEFYAELPRTMAHAFADIIRRIAEGEMPCIIHCSAGKDRTGMAAALILSALDVPRDLVLDDYAMTDRIVASEDDMARSLFIGRDGGERAKNAMRDKFPPEAIAVMRSARPAFLQSAFAGIDGEYGSLASFFTAIGIDENVKQALASRLLEPSPS
ncbi:tyrosine-protein phosphatase [Aurantiacibacter rhizosphaerae]|uniref:Tyrosine specific protein phosphatases domain-containing protein n=1 Tax=Aurantiacibacter rhizosphaerae TaxID=2691582 RepID=A0A844XB04_9SPHN|nr:tyrosine-protein phosphatase [Aurantiacibacter rhizosphaerae]MWV26705.1 hypothetical protein [Aurantiacibacter rhizosphaerae]